ncbi:MAG: sigma-54-dependent Fis family transcriptional regulator [Deltaproteobacteria bacterium]|nr:MAG: sigma-54-dependent Fis family transcriptional regulator [Deltaproteobacteria bacterium]
MLPKSNPNRSYPVPDIFETILNNMEEAIIFLDADDVIKLINRKAEEVRRVRASKLVGKHILTIHPKRSHNRIMELLSAIKSGPHIARERIVHVGNRYFDNTYTAIIGEDGEFQGTLLISRDISEKMQLSNENLSLKEVIGGGPEDTRFIAESPAIRDALETVKTVAPLDSTVLIMGESGTGKEHFAELIHRLSPRADGPLVRVNCAALPEALMESELFGHLRGAFTGAVSNQQGKFVMAEGGSLFLDEIGELPLSSQAKLLRALQQKRIQQVGNPREIEVNVRIIAATNRDLAKEVEAGRFREDLYYRLNVISITIPPLRERAEDVALLSEHFLKRFSKRIGKRPPALAPDTLTLLASHPLPGNVRQLMHALERAVALSKGDMILPDDLPEDLRRTLPKEKSSSSLAQITLGSTLKESLDHFERQLLISELSSAGWKKQEVAKKLGISRKSLWEKIKKYALEGGDVTKQ